MPRSKTATEWEVFAVISLAIKRPVHPPPMIATSTGLRLVMSALSLPCFAVAQYILPRSKDDVELAGQPSWLSTQLAVNPRRRRGGDLWANCFRSESHARCYSLGRESIHER